ncbi:MAG: PhoH family protein [Candidatus Wallbacteria bacterium]|nr:PhoH family protein [Candidatus Wallbacteria bacterium]
MKTFVLDTSVLLHNSQALFAFRENKVIIPLTVIEELDGFKGFSDEKGRHARAVARYLDSLRAEGSLHEGVSLQSGGIIQVVQEKEMRFPGGLDEGNRDNRILMVAFQEQKNNANVCFVTKDLNARVKADALGVYSEDFETNKVNIEELWRGWREYTASPEELATLEREGGVAPRPESSFLANEFAVLKREADLEDCILARFDARSNKLVRIRGDNIGPWGIEPLNAQQLFALEALLDNSIHLVTLVGQAGTGKTLLALAAGLHKTIDERVFRRMLVSRPIMPLGRDIGYLPGTKDEKLTHWMQPIFDNLEYIFTGYLEGELKADEQLRFLMDSKKIELEALTYIRGRSIPNQYLIIDEAQNLTPHEVKTIITRAGEGTKIVLTGDPYQIDNPYLDASSNGLAFLVERFKGQSIFGHVTLVESERSPLSGLAVDLL